MNFLFFAFFFSAFFKETLRDVIWIGKFSSHGGWVVPTKCMESYVPSGNCLESCIPWRKCIRIDLF